MAGKNSKTDKKSGSKDNKNNKLSTNLDNQSGMPTKEQLAIMLQRYSSIQFVPFDGKPLDKKNQENQRGAITIQSETAKFKKPIFMDTDCGKLNSKLLMAMQHEASYENTNSPEPARIILQGNLSLVQKALNAHQKLLGDDPYNPNKPFENDIMLLPGDNIPENLLLETIDKAKEKDKNQDQDQDQDDDRNNK